jgi:hypothetical protein
MSSCIRENRVAVPETARFGRAAGRIILRIEVQDNRPRLEQFKESDLTSVLVRETEVRDSIARIDAFRFGS